MALFHESAYQQNDKGEKTMPQYMIEAINITKRFPGTVANDHICLRVRAGEVMGVVGEAGLYTWGVHFGSQITYAKKFYHWDSRSGTQITYPFKELKWRR